MIRLEIEKYCEDCPEFEPTVDKENIELYDSSLRQHIMKCDTRIFCEHKKRCEKMVDFLNTRRRRS